MRSFRSCFKLSRSHQLFPILIPFYVQRYAMTEKINLGQLLSASIDASRQAGLIIQRVWKSGDLDIKDKGNDDPFTKADVESQQLIMGLLSKKWPALKMIGEEDCGIPTLDVQPNVDFFAHEQIPEDLRSVSIDQITVFVDPLDATKEYTLGNLPAVMSLIGIAINGEAVAGVMFQPFHGSEGRLIYGMKGMGSFGFRTAEKADPNRLVVTTTRSHASREIEECIEALKPTEVLRTGGAGYKVLLVLEGAADIYVYTTPGTKKWDTCACEAILRAAGGSLTDKFGRKIPYFHHSEKSNEDGLVASMRVDVHERSIEKLKSLLEGSTRSKH
eukprot:TRINITY_DN3224_c0_g2_i1.p1 TRINITY_DN3224_c0_g2~~TRINITY_DN3224_c0_g2_i1.p1  ORF type:complete len:330 (+),score=33.92 TRINITY_DN3224_c0_g2_i1:124-1113(+)